MKTIFPALTPVKHQLSGFTITESKQLATQKYHLLIQVQSHHYELVGTIFNQDTTSSKRKIIFDSL